MKQVANNKNRVTNTVRNIYLSADTKNNTDKAKTANIKYLNTNNVKVIYSFKSVLNCSNTLHVLS